MPAKKVRWSVFFSSPTVHLFIICFFFHRFPSNLFSTAFGTQGQRTKSVKDSTSRSLLFYGEQLEYVHFWLFPFHRPTDQCLWPVVVKWSDHDPMQSAAIQHVAVERIQYLQLELKHSWRPEHRYCCGLSSGRILRRMYSGRISCAIPEFKIRKFFFLNLKEEFSN